MEYLIILVLPLLFIVILIKCRTSGTHLYNEAEKLKRHLSHMNKKHHTNFRMDRQIDSRIFFDTYQQKIYLHNIHNYNGIEDIDFFTSLEVIQTKDKKPDCTLLIFTKHTDKPPIEINYTSYIAANDDLQKINSYIHMLTH